MRRVAEELAATEKACAAARVLAAARAIGCGAHKGRGFHDGPAWVAHQGGVSTGQARQALEAAAALKDCPGAKNALLAGEVSWAEASEITRSEAELPCAEEALLGTARQRGLGELEAPPLQWCRLRSRAPGRPTPSLRSSRRSVRALVTY